MERTITNALAPVAGIRTVHVDISEKQVRIEFDAAQVSVDRMKDVLQEEDYPVESVS
jgi:copper chaperone CopZ